MVEVRSDYIKRCIVTSVENLSSDINRLYEAKRKLDKTFTDSTVEHTDKIQKKIEEYYNKLSDVLLGEVTINTVLIKTSSIISNEFFELGLIDNTDLNTLLKMAIKVTENVNSKL